MNNSGSSVPYDFGEYVTFSLPGASGGTAVMGVPWSDTFAEVPSSDALHPEHHAPVPPRADTWIVASHPPVTPLDYAVVIIVAFAMLARGAIKSWWAWLDHVCRVRSA
jgi:hypothetical protein